MLATKTPEFTSFATSACALMGADLDENWLLEVWTGADQDSNRALNWVMDTPANVIEQHKVQWGAQQSTPAWTVTQPAVELPQVTGHEASFDFPAFDFTSGAQPATPLPNAWHAQPRASTRPSISSARHALVPESAPASPTQKPVPAAPHPNLQQQLALTAPSSTAGLPMMTSEQMSAMMMQQSLAIQSMMMQTAMQSMAMQSMMTQSIMMNHPMANLMASPMGVPMMMHPHQRPRMMLPSSAQSEHQRVPRQRREDDDDWWSGSEDDEVRVRSTNPFSKCVARDRIRRRRQLGY